MKKKQKEGCSSSVVKRTKNLNEKEMGLYGLHDPTVTLAFIPTIESDVMSH